MLLYFSMFTKIPSDSKNKYILFIIMDFLFFSCHIALAEASSIIIVEVVIIDVLLLFPVSPGKLSTMYLKGT